MRSALLLVTLLPCLLVVGCFNPDYSGPGGFTCANNGPCPEGQVCLNGVCREEGAPPTDAGPDIAGDSTTDGPEADGPALDGPVSDGPLQDKAVSDGPLQDKAVSDGPLQDKAVSDGPLPDTLKPDMLKPDTLKPDMLKLDAVPPPVCNYNETVATGVNTGPHTIDLALDTTGVPHLYYLNSFSMPRTSMRVKGLWSSVAVGTKKASRLAAGIDYSNEQHVVYQANSGSNYFPYYTYKSKGGSWSNPVQISTVADLGDSLDVGASYHYAYSFALLSRNTIAGSQVSLYKLNAGSGTKHHWTEASSVYEEPRAAAWGKFATSVSDNSANWWWLAESSVLTSSKVEKLINYPAPNQGVCPAPVSVDGSGYIHMVDLSSTTVLRHTSWAGTGGGSPSYTTTSSDAFGCEIDLAVDGKKLPHVVYTKKSGRSSAKGPLVWRHRSSAGAWSAHATIASNVDTDARIAIDNTNKRVYFVYRGAGVNAQTLYLSCRTY